MKKDFSSPVNDIHSAFRDTLARLSPLADNMTSLYMKIEHVQATQLQKPGSQPACSMYH